MKTLTNNFAATLLLCLITITNVLAQEATSLRSSHVSTSTTTQSATPDWMHNQWVWVGVGVAVLLLIALVTSGSRTRRNEVKRTTTTTTEITND